MQTELREDEPFLTLARTFFKSQIILTAGMLPYLLIIRGMDYLSIAIIGMIAIIIVYNGSILAERSLELKKLELERERETPCPSSPHSKKHSSRAQPSSQQLPSL